MERGKVPIGVGWQLAAERETMSVENRYTLGAAVFMVVTSVAYLMLAGR